MHLKLQQNQDHVIAISRLASRPWSERNPLFPRKLVIKKQAMKFDAINEEFRVTLSFSEIMHCTSVWLMKKTSIVPELNRKKSITIIRVSFRKESREDISPELCKMRVIILYKVSISAAA